MQRALFMRVASFEECLIIRSLIFNSIVKIYQYHPSGEPIATETQTNKESSGLCEVTAKNNSNEIRPT